MNGFQSGQSYFSVLITKATKTELFHSLFKIVYFTNEKNKNLSFTCSLQVETIPLY